MPYKNNNNHINNNTTTTLLQTNLSTFITQHQSHHRPIALVTSGGTLSHLERHPVRSIDNFSTGYRGATSAYHFLKNGYAVIHLKRKGSASIFSRVLNGALGLGPNRCLDDECLDRLFDNDNDDEDGGDNETNVTGGFVSSRAGEYYPSLNPRLVYDGDIRSMLRDRSQILRRELLLTVPFESVEDYLSLIQTITTSLDRHGRLALVYCAAAVSDFWIPPDERSVHKISSAVTTTEEEEEGVFLLKLKAVPKVLKNVTTTWCPHAFVVSFKLETDESVLEKKARRAVDEYGVDMVVANLLQSRHDSVSVLHAADDGPQQGGERSYRMSTFSNSDTMEEDLVRFVIGKHFDHIASSSPVGNGGGMPVASPDYFKKKKRDMYNALWWNRMRDWGVQLVLSGMGCFVSYWIGDLVRRRMERLQY